MADQKSPLQSVTFHYIKSNSFRVIHTDGVHGGISPKANVHMSLYSERAPIPRELEYGVTGEGHLTDTEVRRESREGIVREVDAHVVMDYETAIAVRNWLTDKIDAIEERLKNDRSNME